jgi:protein dpnD
MYQVTKHGKTIAQFFSEQEAKWFAVDKAIRDLRKENPNEEAEMEICYDEMPDYEILTEAGIEVEEVEEVEGQLVAPEEVYDFLKVIWSDFDTERKPENLAIMVYTLADTDFDRWLLENMEFGDKEQLALLEEKYAWELGEDLPEWLEKTENRLLLIKELLEKNY